MTDFLLCSHQHLILERSVRADARLLSTAYVILYDPTFSWVSVLDCVHELNHWDVLYYEM